MNIPQADRSLYESLVNDLDERMLDVTAFPNDTECPECGYFDITDERVVLIIKARQAAHPKTTTALFEQARCKCPARKAERMLQDSERYANANLPSGTPKTFDNFKVRPGTEEMLEQARKFSDGQGRFLTIQGVAGRAKDQTGFGNGKSHILEAMARDFLQHGAHVRFDLVANLLNRIRATYDSNSDEQTSIVHEDYQKYHVLFLDDLGLEQGTQWAKAQMITMIEGRIQSGARTVITTNLTRLEMMDLEPRLASRLFATNPDLGYQFLLVPNTATDFRR
jgi:DNA replication protein DnaC